jgi:hypothetical protein
MATPLSVLTEQERAQAMARFDVLQPFLEGQVELRQLAQQHQLALRTLQRWVQRYTTEGLAGLVCQRRSDRGVRRRLPAELHQCLEGLALQTPPLNVAVIWQADHCLLDLLLVRDGQAPAKPWLTVILDDYSRALAGSFLTFDAPSTLHTS